VPAVRSLADPFEVRQIAPCRAGLPDRQGFNSYRKNYPAPAKKPAPV